MIYTFDKDKLVHRNVTKKIIGVGVITTLLFTSLILIVVFSRINDVKYISEETKAIIINEATKANEFSPEKLRSYILQLNIHYPRIVYAQARLESGNFQSNVFRANNNMFGMKVATQRPTTNKGFGENGYAFYSSWRESVEDYAFFSAAYLNNIKTEEEYFEYLKQNYAEAPDYVEKLKAIIKEENTFKTK